MDFKKFEEAVKKLDKNKYHIGRSLSYNEGGFFLDKWDIFRKDMSTKEYFNPKNLVILSSEKGHTLEDIEQLIEEEKNAKR